MILRIAALLGLSSLWLIGADDGTSPWYLQDIGDQRPTDKIVFLDERLGWLQIGTRSILKTSDGGATWIALATNLTGRRTQIAGLWFADPTHGWAAGEVSDHPTVWETRDGGSTWTAKYTEALAFEGSVGTMIDVRFTDQMHGWAVGFNGHKAIIVATVDGGEHWRTQYSGSEITGQFSLVRFWNSSHGWVLARDAVMRTEDGGESWELMHFAPGSIFADIELVGPSDVWVAGAWGHLIHSPDGFAWNEVPVPEKISDHVIGWVKFASKEIGWAWGVKGDVLMTRDGGQTWEQEATPLKIEPDSNVGTYAGASNGSRLFITVDPGRLLVRSIK